LWISNRVIKHWHNSSTVYGLQDFINGRAVEPTVRSSEWATWSKNNATFILHLTLEYTQLEFFINSDSIAAMWQKLANIYEQNLAMN